MERPHHRRPGEELVIADAVGREGSDHLEPVLGMGGELVQQGQREVSTTQKQRTFTTYHAARDRPHHGAHRASEHHDLNTEEQYLEEVELAHRGVLRVEPEQQGPDHRRMEQPRQIIYR